MKLRMSIFLLSFVLTNNFLSASINNANFPISNIVPFFSEWYFGHNSSSIELLVKTSDAPSYWWNASPSGLDDLNINEPSTHIKTSKNQNDQLIHTYQDNGPSSTAIAIGEEVNKVTTTFRFKIDWIAPRTIVR